MHVVQAVLRRPVDAVLGHLHERVRKRAIHPQPVFNLAVGVREEAERAVFERRCFHILRARRQFQFGPVGNEIVSRHQPSAAEIFFQEMISAEQRRSGRNSGQRDPVGSDADQVAVARFILKGVEHTRGAAHHNLLRRSGLVYDRQRYARDLPYVSLQLLGREAFRGCRPRGTHDHVVRTAAGYQRQTVWRAGQWTESCRNQQESNEPLREWHVRTALNTSISERTGRSAYWRCLRGRGR